MITLKSQREIEAMAKSGAIIAGMHQGLRQIIKPGISTWEIEVFGRQYIESHGGRAAQIGFEGFEYATTVSVNDEVAHAFPRKALYLNEGDIVKVDTVVELDGAYSDSAWTYAVGEVSPKVQRLMDVTHKALYLGIDQAQVGNRLGDIGATINAFIEDENGYGNVRDYIGHGIGPTMHEEPAVPHYGVAGRGLRLKPGMTITIEPMVNLGGFEVETSEEDGWTVTTLDGSWSAQYEHTIAITNDGPKILTSQDPEFDAKYLL
ncbi:type I methionyl aminopeptidase [Weissella diestrammenae]|uniref:Methionine aminopeptidase n=1 Tax=Weissella diestrammenae TaxID=1162633 RepID=A0A7G9T5V0_9LACO|nr:type I methionyl aminopeptidase [Weissella diestrammenae]MCM0582305.1 type I methionyl aminopeptidase [Weissella diestrammenae]QNN75475.1 type I methionyl aminopeptidase [Weissella diestrammenae]